MNLKSYEQMARIAQAKNENVVIRWSEFKELLQHFRDTLEVLDELADIVDDVAGTGSTRNISGFTTQPARNILGSIDWRKE